MKRWLISKLGNYNLKDTLAEWREQEEGDKKGRWDDTGKEKHEEKLKLYEEE